LAELGCGGGDDGYLFLGAEQDVERFRAQNGEGGIEPGIEGSGERGYVVEFCGVGG